MKPRSENPRDEGPFAWQSREAAIQAGKLGINAYGIYCALTHFQSAAGADQKRRFAASYEQLANHVGCSQRTVCRALFDLQKAELIRIFSGANKAHRATRNAFFLASISHASQAHGNASQAHDVNASQAWHVNAPQAHKKRIKNSYTAPPQAAAGVTENKGEEPTCSPLTGGSGPQKLPEGILDIPLTSEQLEEGRRLIAFRNSL